MKNIDPRVKRTKKMFLEAMKDLMMKHKDYMDITVTELCKKAGLNRRTFYLHYETIEDILMELEEEFASNFYERTKQYDHIQNVEPIVRAFFDLNEENPIHAKIILSPSLDSLREKIRNKAAQKLDGNNNLDGIRNLDTITQIMIEQYYHSIVVTFYREWVRQKRIMSKDTAIKLASSLITNGISSLIK